MFGCSLVMCKTLQVLLEPPQKFSEGFKKLCISKLCCRIVCVCEEKLMFVLPFIYFREKSHENVCLGTLFFLLKSSMLVSSNIIVAQIWCMPTDCGNYSLCFSFGFGENKCYPYTAETPFQIVLSLVFKSTAPQTSLMCIFLLCIRQRLWQRQVQIQEYFTYMNLSVFEKTWKSLISIYNLCNTFVSVDRMQQ